MFDKRLLRFTDDWYTGEVLIVLPRLPGGSLIELPEDAWFEIGKGRLPTLRQIKPDVGRATYYDSARLPSWAAKEAAKYGKRVAEVRTLLAIMVDGAVIRRPENFEECD